MDEKFKSGLIGFLAGAATGATLGILFAPDEGAKTRKKIKKETKKMTKDAQENITKKVDDLNDYLSGFVNDVKKRFSNLETKMKSQELKK